MNTNNFKTAVMKKMTFLTSLILKYGYYLSSIVFLVILSIIFNSCEEEEIKTPVAFPIIVIDSPECAVLDVDPGDTFHFQVTVYSNTATKKEIKQLEMNVAYEKGFTWDTLWVPDSSELQTFSKEIEIIINRNTDDDYLIVTLKASDISNAFSTKHLFLKIKTISGLIEYDSVYLGAQYSMDYGSFYAPSTNTVYNVTDAKATGQSKIDMIYIYTTNYLGALVSPDNQQVFGINTGQISNLQVHTWVTRNKTTFKMISPLTSKEWANLSADEILEKWDISSNINTLANNLSDGKGGTAKSHVLFKTTNNKVGILRINDISDYASVGNIMFDIKIQE